MRRRSRLILAAALALLLLATVAPLALAHEAPDEGSEWLMADWMLGAFLVFGGAALLAFVVAYKRGLLYDLEKAKYHILTIGETDFYTPEWAKEDPDAKR